jgi:hypothetical protein
MATSEQQPVTNGRAHPQTRRQRPADAAASAGKSSEQLIMTKQEFYHLLITGQLDEPPQEPNDYEYALLLKQQETNRQTAVSRPKGATCQP